MTAWTEHVKAFAKEHNISYPCAISMPACMDSYKGVMTRQNRKKPKEGKVAQPKAKETYFTPLEEAFPTEIIQKKITIQKPKPETKFTPLEEAFPTEIIKKKITIQKPAPIPAPANIEPMVSRIEEKVKALEKMGREHGPVDFEPPHMLLGELIFVHIMKKYGGNCIPRDKERIGLYLSDDPNHNTTVRNERKDYTNFGVSLNECVQRGVRVILIPLHLELTEDDTKTTGHANMLVYRPFQRIVERYEPHGMAAEIPKTRNKYINTQLITIFEEKLTPWIGDVRFLAPTEFCPMGAGYQHIENHLESLEQEGGGFCAMWSCFLAEMVVYNPDKPTKDILIEVNRITKTQPAYLKSVIRGYVLEIEKELDVLLKMLGKPGFKYNLKEKKSFKILDYQSDLDAWLLSTITGINTGSMPLRDVDPITWYKLPGKSEMRKFEDKLIPYVEELERLTKGQLQNIVGFYDGNLKYEGGGSRAYEFFPEDNVLYRVNYIIENYVNGHFEELGSSGLKDLNVIFAEKLYKKKSPGLAGKGYFKKILVKPVKAAPTFTPLKEYIPTEIIRKNITIQRPERQATAAEIKAFREKTMKDRKIADAKAKKSAKEWMKQYAKEQKEKKKEWMEKEEEIRSNRWYQQEI